MKELTLVLALLPLAVLLLLFIVNIFLAIGTSNEAAKLGRNQVPLYAVDHATWVFVVLLTGIVGFLAFWVIHHSALRDHGLFRRS